MENIKIVVEADTSDYKQSLKEAWKIARDTGKAIDQSLRKKLELNVDNFEQKIKSAKAQLKLLDQDTEEAKTLRLNINNYKRNLTEAKRGLNNFLNTGDVATSRLQKKFNQVTDEIKESRNELIKLWKSTKWLDRIDKEIKEIDSQFKKWKISITKYRKEVERLQREAQGMGKNLNGVSDSLKGLAKWFLLYTAVNLFKNALKWASQTAIEFETAFIGVRKTLDWTEQEFKQLEKWFIWLSKQIPITVKELAGIGEIWGQLWVATEDILTFTETVAKIWVTTNLTAEEAGTAFARIANVLQEPISNIENMASSVVWLGNNFATSEKEILNFASEMVAAWWIAWLTSDEIFWISTAFTSVWINAEAWWSAVSKALIKMNNAVIEWWDELDGFATASGLTTAEFKRGWEEDAWQTFGKFITGLWKAGDEWVNTLQKLLWTDIRTTKAFLAVAGAGDLVTESISKSNEEFVKSNALTEEANKRFESTASRLTVVNNKWAAFWNTIGSSMNDTFIPFYESFTDFFTKDLKFVIQFAWRVLLDFFNLTIPELLRAGKQAFINFWENIFTFVQNSITHFSNFTSQLGIFLGTWLSTILSNASKLFDNLATNVWISFWNIPTLAKEWLNVFLWTIEDTVNKAIWLLNKIPWTNIWEVSGFRLDAWTLQKGVDLTSWTKNIGDSIKAELWKAKPWIIKEYKGITDWMKDITNIFTDWATSQVIKRYNEELKQWDRVKEQRKADIVEEIKGEKAKSAEILKLLADIEDEKNKTWWGSKKVLDEQKKQLKELVELEKEKNDLLQDNLDHLEDKYEEVSDVFDDSIENSKDKVKELWEEISSLADDLDKINEKISGVWEEKVEWLAERDLDITKEKLKLEEELRKLEQEWVSSKLAWSISKEILQDNLGNTFWGEADTGENLLKVKEIEEELKKLKEERLLLDSSITEEEKGLINEIKEFEALSITERLLRKTEEKLLWLEEDKRIKEEEIANLEIQKEQEELILVAFEEKKELLDEKYKTTVLQIEQDITDDIKKQAIARIAELEKIRRKAIATAIALARAGKSYSSAWVAESINRETQEALKTTTIINNNEIKTEVDLDSVARKLNTDINS